ncbi:putative sulfate exporter family transporter [Nesterenkonia sp. MY13]|uniref:Putative sulfate exporter family transporter n=1 Tax=Nesterenkonia sedimenti TaxID=1463632 RepID=A0A7X8TGU7_9MICC|nr:putative sulfate exporter family transporter [Nesterenkonia sedimenti]NLS08448.1 putative sulfate exporter family transporter [Nesterenkonia sedimenti]
MSRFDPEQWAERGYEILPGVILAFVGAVLAHRFLGEWLPVSALLIAIVLGMLLRTLGWVPWWGEAGLKWTAKFPLRVGIVLLGLQLAFGDILGLGWEVLVIIVATVLVTFFGIRLLGSSFRTDTTTTSLLATGTAICGASAVAAAAAVLDRGDGKDAQGRDIAAPTATALAVVTLWGTVAMLVLPVLVGLTGMGDHRAGVWIGASVHEVGQVVAAGGMVAATALTVATMVKLARVLMLAPMVVALRIGPGAPVRGGSAEGGKRPPLIPWFVIGFLGAVVLNSTVDIPTDTADLLAQITTMLITVAMVGVGAAVNLRTLVKTGGPAVLLGGAGSVLAAGTALLGILVLL